MELRHLRYFVAVAEEENVSRAARRLRVSQPPLSRQIRDLEQELGVSLLRRTARSVRLTEAGRVFLEEARQVLRRAEEAVLTTQAVAGGKTGRLQVGYAPSLTVEILPHALRAFQLAAPGVTVPLPDLSTEQMRVPLQEGKLHVALMVKPRPPLLRGLRFLELMSYPVCVAVHPGHPLARRRKVRLIEAAGERLIAYNRLDYPEYHEWLAEIFQSTGKTPEVSEEHDSVTSLIAAVEAGRGVSIVPSSLACLTGERLQLRLLDPSPVSLVVGVATLPGSRERAVDQFVEAVLRSLPQGGKGSVQSTGAAEGRK